MTMDHFYPGCYYKNADGTNKLIASGENCLSRTNMCFWKDPSDVPSGIKTRSCMRNEPNIGFREVDK